ncbi:pentapeptide repeat-containing protein [Candidatus Allofournierella merdipullorum]|uniref:pentapeptide repeat-containing protein n=1 Tax=Candidatus Allofournierella merdipullorum TaxID=2838595 RepID=UPI003AB7007F
MKEKPILPPSLPDRPEPAERGEELVAMARATQEPLARWRFSGLDLCGEDLREMRFEQCVFEGCRFTGADLQGASFVDCLLKNCEFSAVRAGEAYFLRCRFQGVKALAASLPDCRLAHVQMTECNFTEANFTGASVEQARLEECDFSAASLAEWRHKGLSLAHSRFFRTSFFKTPLAGLDFTDSELEGVTVSDDAAELKGATVNVRQAAELARLLGVIVR